MRLASKALTVRKNRKVQLSLPCPATTVGNCVGTDTLRTIGPVSAKAAASRKKRRKKVLTLGSARFSIPAGRTRKVVIKLSKAALKLLAKKRRLRVHEVVVAHDSRGISKKSSAKLTLKAPRKKRRR